jgi:hypothetical protein
MPTLPRSCQRPFTVGLVSRGPPIQTALPNCTRDEGMPFELGNQVPISSPRNRCAQTQRPTVVSVAEMTSQAFHTGRSK